MEALALCRRRTTDTVEGAAVSWAQLEVEPRWLGQESVDCVAALAPSTLTGREADELRRLSAGAKARDETAIVISMLGTASHVEPVKSFLQGADITLLLPNDR